MPTRSDMKAETQRRVLAEADRLFRERGLAATTVRDIAAASGVSVGTVMAVGDKSALLVKVFDSLIEETHAARRETPPRGGNRVVRVLSLVEPFLQLFASRQELARAYGSILLSVRDLHPPDQDPPGGDPRRHQQPRTRPGRPGPPGPGPLLRLPGRAVHLGHPAHLRGQLHHRGAAHHFRNHL